MDFENITEESWQKTKRIVAITTIMVLIAPGFANLPQEVKESKTEALNTALSILGVEDDEFEKACLSLIQQAEGKS